MNQNAELIRYTLKPRDYCSWIEGEFTVLMTPRMADKICGASGRNAKDFFDMMFSNFENRIPKRVIYHAPATIVYWDDGTKTVVKCDDRDTYSKEAGLALCYMKKMLGSSRAFNDVLKEWAE